jgi:hypothetical protein
MPLLPSPSMRKPRSMVLESAVLPKEIMKISDHNATLLVVPQVVEGFVELLRMWSVLL